MTRMSEKSHLVYHLAAVFLRSKVAIKKKYLVTLSLIITLSIVNLPIVISSESDKKWGYDDRNGPEHWADIGFEDCEGKMQSPVDIETDHVVTEELPKIEFEYHHTALTILNNGHTIEVEYDEGSEIVVGGDVFELLQFHFHAPSEHTLNGANFEIEMHLVHSNEDGELAYIVVFIKEGKFPNKDFRDLWDFLPSQAGHEVESDFRINVEEMLPGDRSYYTYEGSLTTPPCSEGVKWMLLKEPIELSRWQILQFKLILRLSCCEQNNRPTQELHEREIEMSEEED